MYIMERGNASELTYETTSKVSMSGFLAKQTLEEEILVGVYRLKFPPLGFVLQGNH